jgi:hypothetical protein
MVCLSNSDDSSRDAIRAVDGWLTVVNFGKPIRGQMTVINDDRWSAVIQNACQLGGGNSSSETKGFIVRAERAARRSVVSRPNF